MEIIHCNSSIAIHPLLFIHCYSSTAIHPLLFIHCYSSTAIHPLQFIHSYSSTAIHPLLFIHCYSSIAIHPLLFTHCYSPTAIHPLLFIHCYSSTAIHPSLFVHCYSSIAIHPLLLESGKINSKPKFTTKSTAKVPVTSQWHSGLRPNPKTSSDPNWKPQRFWWTCYRLVAMVFHSLSVQALKCQASMSINIAYPLERLLINVNIYGHMEPLSGHY